MQIECGSHQPVNAKDYIAPKTALSFTIGIVLAVLSMLVTIAVTWGIAIIAFIVIGLYSYFKNAKARAMLHGSAIQSGPDQFPEIHACVERFALRLGMKQTPDLYIIEDNTNNAAAIKIGKRNVVLLIDDIVDSCLRSGDPRALAFVIGHELAHHALGHTNTLRSYAARVYKPLSRLDEISCDAVANQLVGDSAISLQALAVMLSGPQLAQYVNFDALSRQADEVTSNRRSKKAESSLTHPLLLRRFSLLAHDQRQG